MRALKVAIFAAIPSLLLLGGLEMLVRSQSVDYHDGVLEEMMGQNQPCYRPSLSKGYEAVPGVCKRNDYGMYAPSYAVDKEDESYRVLLLGDSIADQEKWVRTLEFDLNERMPERRVELWNSGVPGYDSCSELAVLEEQGVRINPDHILLQFCLNDFMVSRAAIVPISEDKARLFVGPQYFDLPFWTLRSRLATWLVLNYGLIGGIDVPEAGAELNMDRATRCLQRIQTISEDLEIPFTVAVFPAFYTDEPSSKDQLMFPLGYGVAEKRIQRVVEQLKLQHVDLRRLLLPYGPLELLRDQPGDPWHPNIDGQTIIGALLSEQMHGEIEAGQ